jgi:hypothetical protein
MPAARPGQPSFARGRRRVEPARLGRPRSPHRDDRSSPSTRTPTYGWPFRRGRSWVRWDWDRRGQREAAAAAGRRDRRPSRRRRRPARPPPRQRTHPPLRSSSTRLAFSLSGVSDHTGERTEVDDGTGVFSSRPRSMARAGCCTRRSSPNRPASSRCGSPITSIRGWTNRVRAPSSGA